MYNSATSDGHCDMGSREMLLRLQTELNDRKKYSMPALRRMNNVEQVTKESSSAQDKHKSKDGDI